MDEDGWEHAGDTGPDPTVPGHADEPAFEPPEGDVGPGPANGPLPGEPGPLDRTGPAALDEPVLAGPPGPDARTREDRPAVDASVDVHVDHLEMGSAQDVPARAPSHETASERDMLSLAADSGWLDPSAAPMAALGGLLSAAGLRIKRLSGATIERLRERLRRGQRVVVRVDAEQLRRSGPAAGDRLSEAGTIPGQAVDREVEVIDVRPDASGRTTVVLDDHGGVLGRREVPLADFERAWKRSGRFALTTLRGRKPPGGSDAEHGEGTEPDDLTRRGR